MKAVTIYQPWASLIAMGVKQFETRSWTTSYRGPIAIHAGLKNPYQIIMGLPDWVSKEMKTILNIPHFFALPRGCIIATAEIAECWRIVSNPGTDINIAKNISVGAELDVSRKHPRFHDYIVPSEQEKLFGDWAPGRYAWELVNMKMLYEPISAKGKQRIWEWETNEVG